MSFKKIAKWLVLLLLVISGLLVMQFSRLKIDYNFEKFFPIDDEETSFFLSYRKKFEPDNDFVLLAIENKKGVFELDFLKKIERLQKELKNINEVQIVSSILTEKERIVYPGGLLGERPYIQLKENNLKRDREFLVKNVEMKSLFLSENEKATSLFIRHTDFLVGEPMDSFVEELKMTLSKYSFDGVHLAGRTVGQTFYIERMSNELILFFGLSFVLILVFLLIAFRSGWGLILPLIVLLLTMLWIVGFIAVYGEPVSVVMTTLPSVMFVVAMSDVIHLLSRYLDAVRAGNGNYPSIQIALREVGMPTFLTSITTAVGFFSLYFVSVEPVQVFGIVAGVGVMIAFFLTIVLLPILIYFIPSPKHVKGGAEDPFWKKK
ncbi:MAG: MMPL family transporter, partial [Bacteroidetes bacterium]|nr:MMPL family transporter [Bacteroidota bacterium]